MSFSSLLSQITSDKNIKEKIKVASVANISTSTSTSKAKSNASSTLAKKPSNSSSFSNTTRHAPFTSSSQDDPAVRRLKEARRKERERLDALKGKTKPSSSSSKAKSTTTTNNSSKQRTQNRSSTSKSTSPSPALSARGIPPPIVPARSRYKFKPSKHSIPRVQGTQSHHNSSTTSSFSSPSSSSSTSGRDGIPKMSFKDLMKQAEAIKQPTIAAQPFNNLSNTKKSPQKEPSKAYQSLQKVRLREDKPPAHASKRPTKSSLPQREQTKPAGFAKPNSDLLNKLKNRKGYVSQSERSSKNNRKHPQMQMQRKKKEQKDSYSIDVGDDDDEDEDEYGYGYNYAYDDEYDSEDDGFIVDEDEESSSSRRQRERDYDNMRSQGYSKDEIWQIFNRGKKRDHYSKYDDYDSDDMEATGTEILEDEERTLKQAKLDDLREQKLLEERALQKKKLLKKH